MKLTETKLDELMNVAETENEQALLSILYAIKGARCLNAETLLASCVAEVVSFIADSKRTYYDGT